MNMALLRFLILQTASEKKKGKNKSFWANNSHYYILYNSIRFSNSKNIAHIFLLFFFYCNEILKIIFSCRINFAVLNFVFLYYKKKKINKLKKSIMLRFSEDKFYFHEFIFLNKKPFLN